jgi:hypothetical protein
MPSSALRAYTKIQTNVCMRAAIAIAMKSWRAMKGDAQFAMTIKAELERWGPVVKASGFVAED